MIAVITLFDDPYIQADLNAYDRHYALPACTIANHCLRKLNEQGQRQPLPPTDQSGQFITESALGVELAHGICESCMVLLVEASSPFPADIGAAVDAAARAGATVAITSITLSEDSSDLQYESAFAPPKLVLVAAAGDAGYEGGSVSFPASLPDVIAVGGTKLRVVRGGRYGGEQAWIGTASGCSSWFKAGAWQANDAAKVGCVSSRAVADVSAMAAPGAIVHVTGAQAPGGPWYVASGTSVSAPIIAAVIGLAGSVGSDEAQLLYRRARTHPRAFHDIVGGADFGGCTSPICKAVRGYDGPTGLGTPHGLSAFLPRSKRS
jgi:subtilase family serine protease